MIRLGGLASTRAGGSAHFFLLVLHPLLVQLATPLGLASRFSTFLDLTGMLCIATRGAGGLAER